MAKPSENGATSSKLGTAWALVIETVEARDIPPRRGYTNWAGLFEEILLRLEKTLASQALMLEFERETQARSCCNQLKAAAEKRGLDEQVEIFYRKLDGGDYAVYIRRSPKYKGLKAESKRGRRLGGDNADDFD